MKQRTTQIILAAIALLLAANLFATARDAVAPAQEAATAPSVLRAQLIELVDARGQTRAQLKVEDSGEAVFRMKDANGTIRVKLGASEVGSGLLLLDDRTEPGVQLLAKNTGTTLTLSEKGKENRVIKP